MVTLVDCISPQYKGVTYPWPGGVSVCPNPALLQGQGLGCKAQAMPRALGSECGSPRAPNTHGGLQGTVLLLQHCQHR